jgi:putative endonuclease
MRNTYYVYILTNRWHTVFYVGVTNDLIRRTHEHRTGLVEGFTKRYNICKLVYFEDTSDVNAALHREKLIKKWKREFKFDAIHRMNPEWNDLYEEMTGTVSPGHVASSCHAPHPAALVGASPSTYGEMPQQVRHDRERWHDNIPLTEERP